MRNSCCKLSKGFCPVSVPVLTWQQNPYPWLPARTKPNLTEFSRFNWVWVWVWVSPISKYGYGTTNGYRGCWKPLGTSNGFGIQLTETISGFMQGA
ncbi:hypothetical protein MTR_5g055080 [Medicago truncatula]|uniref:Uncharacterized protein n=1 Tax=Medicago truncatula TaxID=3880 RepID=G7JZE0_MEDTR|nr:hypothetical protein MTR_5g055080 [Medicago truncatula]